MEIKVQDFSKKMDVENTMIKAKSPQYFQGLDKLKKESPNKIQKKKGAKVVNAVCAFDVDIRKKSDPFSEIVTKIAKNDTVKLTGYQQDGEY